MLDILKKLKPSKKDFRTKYLYLIVGFVLGFVCTNIYWWYGKQQNVLASNESEVLDFMDEVEESEHYLIDSITIDDVSENEDSYIAVENDKTDISKDLIVSKGETKSLKTHTVSTAGVKKMKVNDIKSIARTLKGSSISAKTIIHEVNRIITQENNSITIGSTIVQALSEKLPKNTKAKLIKNVESISVSNNIIRVKLKDASNIKLTFKTDEGRKTIKVYDNAKINIKNQSSKISADVTGFSYQHLGMYWQVKDLVIQQKKSKGTMDIKLKGKLKDVDLPTIALGNLYRKML